MTSVASDLRGLVEAAFADPARLESAEYRQAVQETVAGLDRGELRLAELDQAGGDYTVTASLSA